MKCTEVNIPEVDNTLQECNDFYPSSCIVVNKRFPTVSSKQNLPFNEFMSELIDIIKTQNYKIKLLETKLSENLPKLGIGLHED